MAPFFRRLVHDGLLVDEEAHDRGELGGTEVRRPSRSTAGANRFRGLQVFYVLHTFAPIYLRNSSRFRFFLCVMCLEMFANVSDVIKFVFYSVMIMSKMLRIGTSQN